jgi:hypothetical protein
MKVPEQRKVCLKAGLPLGDDADLLERDRAMSGGDAAAMISYRFSLCMGRCILHAGRKSRVPPSPKMIQWTDCW